MMWLWMVVGCGANLDVAGLESRIGELESENQRLDKESEQQQATNRALRRKLVKAQTALTKVRLGLGASGKIAAVFETSKGAIRCELFPDDAPNTVVNFVELAEGKREWTHPGTKEKTTDRLYDGTVFHRVIPKFMIQGGDPLGKGTGGPGYKFEDEVDSERKFDAPGLLAMANSGPNTNGSQFFITDRSKPAHLTGKHTIFGACENLDVVESIATVATNRRNQPDQAVVLKKVRIVR
jgi:peptidyl-prolyl cis-trans isomerase A (cyclophilin A)